MGFLLLVLSVMSLKVKITSNVQYTYFGIWYLSNVLLIPLLPSSKLFLLYVFYTIYYTLFTIFIISTVLK